jgi:hypothetical protein
MHFGVGARESAVCFTSRSLTQRARQTGANSQREQCSQGHGYVRVAARHVSAAAAAQRAGTRLRQPAGRTPPRPCPAPRASVTATAAISPAYQASWSIAAGLAVRASFVSAGHLDGRWPLVDGHPDARVRCVGAPTHRADVVAMILEVARVGGDRLRHLHLDHPRHDLVQRGNCHRAAERRVGQ